MTSTVLSTKPWARAADAAAGRTAAAGGGPRRNPTGRDAGGDHAFRQVLVARGLEPFPRGDALRGQLVLGLPHAGVGRGRVRGR